MADSEITMDKTNTGSPKIAIFIGIIIDIIGGFICEFGLLFLYAYVMYKYGANESISAIRDNYPIPKIIRLTSRLFIPFLAGYFSALIAKKHIFICAIIVAFITSLVGVLFGGNAQIEGALGHSIFGNTLAFFCVLLGAFMYKITNSIFNCFKRKL